MPMLDRKARRHVDDLGHTWEEDAYGEVVGYTTFECKYCDDDVSLSRKRWCPTDGLPEEWRDASDSIIEHVRKEHGVDP